MDWNRIQGDKFIGKVSYEVGFGSFSIFSLC